LKAVQQAMVNSGLCRNVVNQRVGKVVRVFRWAVERELVPGSVLHGLKAVSGLRKGRSAARETEPVKPVPDAFIAAIRPHVSRQVWAMIELQRLSGMRPGEVTIMRTGDVDTSGRTWVYRPGRHKTDHHGKGREVYLGPKARAVLRPWLRTDLGAFLFSPREAAEEFRARKRAARRSPRTPSQEARRPKRNPKRAPGESYDTRAYTHAIHRACEKAGVPKFGPNRLRHNAATMIRRESGLDAARAVLGHSDADTTTIYAERDRALAVGAMERVG
jgi:integrase